MWNVLSICNELFLKSRGKWAHRFIWFSTVVSSVFCWRLFLLSMAQSATSNLLTVPKIVSRISVVTLLLLSGIYSWAEWGYSKCFVIVDRCTVHTCLCISCCLHSSQLSYILCFPSLDLEHICNGIVHCAWTLKLSFCVYQIKLNNDMVISELPHVHVCLNFHNR